MLLIETCLQQKTHTRQKRSVYYLKHICISAFAMIKSANLTAFSFPPSKFDNSIKEKPDQQGAMENRRVLNRAQESGEDGE